ncbi:2-isopropylmalate synthase [Actinoplanes sp. NPDC023936]|uniref:2-isopropylmalate synthase n=1 Tax=Actinoplanes sp. NPDC023936 TaxID=3154910 RepID=UPI0033EEC508
MARSTFPVRMPLQRSSSLPVARYAAPATVDLADRTWPARRITEAPRWLSTDLRDGNQALPRPMDIERKSRLFRMLTRIGYKEIEIGFPAASETEFAFTRKLIENDEIPDDVVIQAIVPARADLIRRTFEALAGAPRAIVHLYNSTSAIQRRVVFGMDRAGIRQLAVDHARLCRELADEHPGVIGFEYSPESFSQTELDFAADICSAVMDVWQPAPDREIVINLPATVECAGPGIFADQVEWMSRNLPYRENVCLSLHPHNDRGTGVAAAELGLQAGAQRVEGCLFGNGERTGNVCLLILGLNLMSHGVDPQIDFSEVAALREEFEECTGMRVPERYPYAGELVHTSFSGSHQDAINKGLRALEERAEEHGRPVAEEPWNVPYLPIDPQDIGRSYEAIIRLNSQSGKGGVDYVLQAHYGLQLPRGLQREMSVVIQHVSDEEDREILPEELWESFRAEFLPATTGVQLVSHKLTTTAAGDAELKAEVVFRGEPYVVSGSGAGVLPAFAEALADVGVTPEVLHHAAQPFTSDDEAGTLSYVQCRVAGRTVWGCGFDPDPDTAALRGLCAALHRAQPVLAG